MSENEKKLVTFGKTNLYFRTKVKNDSKNTNNMEHQRVYTMFCFCSEGVHQAIHKWYDWFHRECLELGATRKDFLEADGRLARNLGEFVCERHPDLNWRDLPLVIEGELEGLDDIK